VKVNKVGTGVSGNIFSVKRVFEQV